MTRPCAVDPCAADPCALGAGVLEAGGWHGARPLRLCMHMLLVLGGAGCSGPQRMLDVRGPAADQIAGLWWLILAMAVVTAVAISGLFLFAVRQARRRQTDGDVGEVDGRRLVWIGAVIVPVIFLFTALIASYRLSSEVYPPRSPPEGALEIEIIGHQYWWEIHYPDHGVVTANEFHIPAGRPVRLSLTSRDVIHSFWLPQLQGKIDLIPGRVHEWWIRADSAGLFRGQCAEFCGLSHALMGFWVTAVDPSDFDTWIAQRQRPTEALPALDSRAERGLEVFLASDCNQCHTTPQLPRPPALSATGPDLSDFGTRRTIGAGRMPNTPENLARWIRSPQALKPGNRMPGTELTDARMDALMTYLYSLR